MSGVHEARPAIVGNVLAIPLISKPSTATTFVVAPIGTADVEGSGYTGVPGSLPRHTQPRPAPNRDGLATQ